MKRLREFKPEEGGEDEDGVVEEVVQREFTVAEQGEEGSKEVEESR